jgi:hypothetical protein
VLAIRAVRCAQSCEVHATDVDEPLTALRGEGGALPRIHHLGGWSAAGAEVAHSTRVAPPAAAPLRVSAHRPTRPGPDS